ncbi:MAG: glutamine-hydrolyzing GMP synthase [Chloroflexi bacterium]|nr:glutamine-hydrolyzing GMP synthase [Chloroflexota bacterium]
MADGLHQECIAILDFGSQYAQLIARRVREAQVYCELVSPSTDPRTLANLKGVILSGGPASVYDEGAPSMPDWLHDTDVPILSICYGLHLIAQTEGGRVQRADRREYGPARLNVLESGHPIFADLPSELEVWMSHGDQVEALPRGYRRIAASENCTFAAIATESGRVGLQFHPEVAHTPLGAQIIRNFLFGVCGCAGDWTPGRYVDDHVAAIARQIGSQSAICALSGGVDSMVAATLVDRAIGDRLTCVFVDNGLLREDEAAEVVASCQSINLNVRAVDARDLFLDALAGVVDPEEKRRRIGGLFIDVFRREALKCGNPAFLVQGTLYPDVIESATSENPNAAKIKTHHNVGGLPKDLPFTLVEPLRYLFKDEVREVGRALGLPDRVVGRQPFPGPGLAVRILGEITPDRLSLLRKADQIVTQEIERAGLYDEIWQAFAVLTPLQTVGVMGDGRTYGNLVAIRAVTSDDAMTADWARIPHEILATMSSRIVNEVPGVNRVVYDISSKPPATIEWE